MTLSARIVVRLGVLALDVALEVGDDEVVAVLGPNGAGKTTLLRTLAGLQPIDEGRVEVGDRLLDDGDRTFVAPEQRPVGTVFQSHLLFPHLTALDNIAFGLRARGVRKTAAREVAARWLTRLGVGDVASLGAPALSGGQAQRVALARALAIEPSLLLLDEPLASLDAATKVGVRAELRRHLTGASGARVLVTHDPLDAVLLADRVIVLEDGRVTHEGTATEVAARPRTPYAAELAGTNLWRGTADGTAVALEGGGVLHLADPEYGAVLLTARPSALSLHPGEPAGSARNAWPATVQAIEPLGERARVRLDGHPPAVAEVTAAAVADLGLQAGVSVWVALKATELSAYPALPCGRA